MGDQSTFSMKPSLYLERYAWPNELFPDYLPGDDLQYIIVIPAYKEKFLANALESLNQCTTPKGKVLILVIINEAENEPAPGKKINQQCIELLSTHESCYKIIYSYQVFPVKKAGVGLARKVGMDEAVRIFQKSGQDGVIICYDADCTCEQNYLIEIEKAFTERTVKAGVVFYEHQLQGTNHREILDYELYLRYYIDSLRYAGFPFAHQTLGSCIVVRSSAYKQYGGMNTRKAGEDFYFLNKVIPHGSFVEINETTIHPSDRVSDRVPFGTGKAVGQLIDSNGPHMVYHPKVFEELKVFFDQVPELWKSNDIHLPPSVQSFLGEGFFKEFDIIRSQTSSFNAFRKRFFLWFDAFRILKFVHYTRDNLYSNCSLEEALQWLEEKVTDPLPSTHEEKLSAIRSFDRRFKQDQTGF